MVESPKTEEILLLDEHGDPTPEEQRASSILALFILLSIVSLSFFYLDRHSPYSPVSKRLLAAAMSADGSLLFAEDHLAMAAIEDLGEDFSKEVRGLPGWPPPGPTLSFDASTRQMTAAGMELLFEEGPFSLWLPRQDLRLPHFALARVDRIGPEGESTCRRKSRGSFQCGDAPWTRIGKRTLTIQGRNEECIWAHPLRDETLRITYPNVRSRYRVHSEEVDILVLRTALRDSAVGTGVPVEITVQYGEETRHFRHPDLRGWQEFVIPDAEEELDLELSISAREIGRRHLCYRFEMR